MILSSFVTGMELHVATAIEESQLWNYKAINCVELLRLTLETLPLLGPPTWEITVFMVKFQRKLVICSDYNISTFKIIRWEEKFQLAWPIAPNLG